MPIGSNVAFALLAARFDYPDVLRRPTSEVLALFRAGGSRLVLTWWAFALTAALMLPLVVMLAHAMRDVNPALLSITTTTGVLAAFVQFLGLLMLCALEFVGSHEPTGWKVAEKLTPVAYIAWSLWLIGTGVALLV